MTPAQEKKEQIAHIKELGQQLKEEIWAFLEQHKVEHKGLKVSVNETLDLIDELELP